MIGDWIYSMLQPSIVTIPDVTGQVDAWARHLLRMRGLRVPAVEQTVPSDYAARLTRQRAPRPSAAPS